MTEQHTDTMKPIKKPQSRPAVEDTAENSSSDSFTTVYSYSTDKNKNSKKSIYVASISFLFGLVIMFFLMNSKKGDTPTDSTLSSDKTNHSGVTLEENFSKEPELLTNLGRRFIAINYTEESHPNKRIISRVRGGVGYIKPDTWILFRNFHFGESAKKVTVVASSGGLGGIIEGRIDSIEGPVIVRIRVIANDNWQDYRTHDAELLQKVKGKHNLYWKFLEDPEQKTTSLVNGHLLDLKSFRFD